MTDPHEENLHVYLAVDDAHAAQAAGAKFVRTLAGADPAEDFVAAARDPPLNRRS